MALPKLSSKKIRLRSLRGTTSHTLVEWSDNPNIVTRLAAVLPCLKIWLIITLLNKPDKQVLISWKSTWISHGIWNYPFIARIRILLSPSIWALVNPACTIALIWLRMDVASATNTAVARRLNVAPCINFPFQLQMMDPHAAPWEISDPSKLIFTNRPWGFCHVIHLVYLRLLGDECGMNW